MADQSFMERAAMLYAKYSDVHERCTNAMHAESPGWSPLLLAAQEAMSNADTAVRHAWSMLDRIERTQADISKGKVRG